MTTGRQAEGMLKRNKWIAGAVGGGAVLAVGVIVAYAVRGEPVTPPSVPVPVVAEAEQGSPQKTAPAKIDRRPRQDGAGDRRRIDGVDRGRGNGRDAVQPPRGGGGRSADEGKRPGQRDRGSDKRGKQQETKKKPPGVYREGGIG